MDDLIAFLHAQLRADEAHAQQLFTLSVALNKRHQKPWSEEPDENNALMELGAFGRRLLTDVAAARQIIALHGHESRYGYGADDDATPGSYGHIEQACETCGSNDSAVRWPCPTLRLLALPFASHPDYRAEWRP